MAKKRTQSQLLPERIYVRHDPAWQPDPYDPSYQPELIAERETAEHFNEDEPEIASIGVYRLESTHRMRKKITFEVVEGD